MKRLLERLFGPLSPYQQLPSESGRLQKTWKWGYVPLDERRAMRGAWILFAGIVAISLVVLLIIVIVRVAQ